MRKDPTEWRNGFKRWKETRESPWKAGKRLPRYTNGKELYKYSWNPDTQSWDRYTADLMGEVFNDLVITPSSNRKRFNYEKQPTVLHSPSTETDSQYTQRRIIEELNRRTWRSNIADAISLLVGFTPVGNVELGLNAAAATARGNYGEAAALGAGILLPGMFRNAYKAAKRVNKTADELYEHFVKTGREDLALRMLDDKAKKLNPVTKNNGEILPLYRGDTGEYNIINERSKNPVFLSTDKDYAEMYTSNRRFYELDPYDEYSQQAVDLSDINPDRVKEYYGFGNIFNAAPHVDINSGVAKSFFDANDYLFSKKLADDIWNKYLPAPSDKELHPDFPDFKRAVRAIRSEQPIPDDIPKSILEDALNVTKLKKVNERQATRFIRSGRYSGNNKKNPNGYFRKKDIGEGPKFDGTPQSYIAEDLWYKNSFDPKKIWPLRTTKYDGLSGRDIPLSNEVEFWRDSKGREFAFKNSNNIKLRAITRDDEGRLIPLSERLNLKNPDRRFFLPYLIGGGIGYGAYDKYTE